MGRGRRAVRALGAVGYALAAMAYATTLVGVWRAPAVPLPVAPDVRPVVDDVTRLNPVALAGVVAPRTTEEVAAAVRRHPGPIAVGGGRYSMGGQTVTPGGLQLDLRRLRGVVALDTAARTITVRAGTPWREVQQAIDPAGLAVKVMQTYNTFTVGGALSVNAHGRYVGQGPVAGTVRAVRLVLADGSVADASRSANRDLFFAALGGYGGVGVITEATLDLAPNTRVRRDDTTMALRDYGAYFRRAVRGRADVVFHNADVYPAAYERVRAVSYRVTREPATVAERLRPADQASGLHRAAYALMTGWSRGPWVREHLIDPALFRGNPVTWRNYEASYDVSELEPASRARSTYVLQEYFAPVDSLGPFVDRARRVLRRRGVRAVNISIRHAEPDPGTLLAYAPVETFAFVLYYRQDTDPAARREVGRWTRELIDAAVASGGRYYLPYQPHATRAQFLRAYPRAPEYFAVKRRVDPAGKFTNTLWDLYAPGPDGSSTQVTAARIPAVLPAEVRLALDSVPAYARAEGAAFLTHPEWDLVYSSDAYARWLGDARPPSGYPYAASVGTFWRSYLGAWRHARARYSIDPGTHVMLAVIGTSTAAEYGLKGLYENTVGRLTELAMPVGGTAEDRYAARVAAEYGRLIHEVGWYEYPFGRALAGLWREVPATGPGVLRKWERRLALSAEYGVKAIYARLIAAGTAAGYAPDERTRHLVIAGWDDAAAADPALRAAGVRHLARLDRGYALLAVPRYDPYRDALRALARRSATLRVAEASGCDVMTLVGTGPAGWTAPAGARPVVAYADPADPTRTRALLEVRVRDLLDVVAALDRTPGVVIEHAYDY